MKIITVTKKSGKKVRAIIAPFAGGSRGTDGRLKNDYHAWIKGTDKSEFLDTYEEAIEWVKQNA